MCTTCPMSIMNKLEQTEAVSCLTCHEGIIVDEGQRRENWNESVDAGTVLSQPVETRQLTGGQFVEVVPAESVDEYEKEFIGWRGCSSENPGEPTDSQRNDDR